MLKLTYAPTEAEIEAALDADRASPRAEVISNIPRKTKFVKEILPGFEIAKQGVKYKDPESGLLYIDLYHKLEKVELKMEVSVQQQRYAKAFRTAYSDATPEKRRRLPSAI